MITKRILATVLSYLLIFNPLLAQQANQPSAKAKKSSKEFNIRELALPSEVKKLGKSSGAVYYSPSVKGKVLIPVHFWGEINKSGLHFVPLDTTLVQGLSMAGGPKQRATLDKVRLTRRSEGKLQNEFYNLEGGGEDDAFNAVLQPNDTIFIEKNDYLEDRSYYTSLFGVIATVLSSILLYREVKR
ncbi:MAG: hypothetical protein GY909_06985 [Oligoflexia bacterium]|nr:hypothetical protein [Oligoflexia bacterium]